MPFFIGLLCFCIGGLVGGSIVVAISNGVIANLTETWVNALVALNALDLVVEDEEDKVYKNATVVVETDADGEKTLSWYRQDNTVEMTMEEWEKEKKRNEDTDD